MINALAPEHYACPATEMPYTAHQFRHTVVREGSANYLLLYCECCVALIKIDPATIPDALVGEDEEIEATPPRRYTRAETTAFVNDGMREIAEAYRAYRQTRARQSGHERS